MSKSKQFIISIIYAAGPGPRASPQTGCYLVSEQAGRWKTKTLEKDYEILKRQFECVKAENDALQAHNQKRHAEIIVLKTREPTESINLNKKNRRFMYSDRSENSSEIKLDISRNNNPAIDTPISANPNIASRSSLRPNAVAQQLFRNSSRAEMQCAKMDQIVNNKEESLCNIFSGAEDQAGFWPWLEQQHFN